MNWAGGAKFRNNYRKDEWLKYVGFKNGRENSVKRIYVD